MQCFKAASTNPEFYSLSSYFRRDDSDRNQTRFTDLRELEQSATAFPHDDAVVLSPSSMFGLKANNVGGVPDSLHYGTLNVGGCLDIGSTITGTGGRGCVDTGQQQPYMYQQQKGTTTSGNGQFENWGDNSAMADNSQRTDTYTDVDIDDKNHHGALMVVDSTEQAKERTTGDQKTLRRLAQNGEAARKSRLRKKWYGDCQNYWVFDFIRIDF
ncbi:transcription factor PERIANTHIA-like isoform X2 [Malus domestica]|uniref:transcription factor PERIANTHIA-like isoform X2 n=1 Tax=Malus domestica TaxID=3750 RepID=UPI003975708B